MTARTFEIIEAGKHLPNEPPPHQYNHQKNPFIFILYLSKIPALDFLCGDYQLYSGYWRCFEVEFPMLIVSRTRLLGTQATCGRSRCDPPL
jgi:hypothetical protein